MNVKVRVSGKQKDMAGFVESLGNILRQYWTLPPEIKSDPTTQHLMNQLLEASGLSPASLGGLTSRIASAPQISEQATKPIRELAETETIR